MNEDNCMSSETEVVNSAREPRRSPIIQQPTVADNRARIVRIIPLNHGYMVEIGCQSFAIETSSKLLANLHEYLNSPQEVEKLWMEGKFEL